MSICKIQQADFGASDNVSFHVFNRTKAVLSSAAVIVAAVTNGHATQQAAACCSMTKHIPAWDKMA